MLQAMNTGHEGSLTTAHANSPRDVLSRLETMVLMSGLDLPVRAIRDQISSALDLIIHQERIQDGSRKITYITEVQKMEGDVIVLQDLFRYVQTGFDESGKALGEFRPTGLQPQFLSKFKSHNVEYPAFMQKARRGSTGKKVTDHAGTVSFHCPGAILLSIPVGAGPEEDPGRRSEAPAGNLPGRREAPGSRGQSQ